MRKTLYFDCAKCGRTNPDYLTFGTRSGHYCLDHIPWRVRVRMWFRERGSGRE